MANRTFRSFLKATVRQLATLMVILTVLLGVTQTAVKAESINLFAAPEATLQIALAASSRFAAEAESADLQEPIISEERLEEKRAERRAWQREASADAYEATDNEDSVGETVKDKLNLDEITEENEIVK